MNDQTRLAAPLDQIDAARAISHAAVQLPSLAARANLAEPPDDSHASLQWHPELGALVGLPLDAEGRFRLGVSFSTGDFLWLDGETAVTTIALGEVDALGAQDWCDARLAQAGLNKTGDATLPYALPPVNFSDIKLPGMADALRALGACYGQAYEGLTALVKAHAHRAVSPPAIRCWPHHFDLAVLFALEDGDPESAQSVGIGLSPGDGNYGEPYFYCSPWPAPDHRPETPSPLRWHTDGFVSVVCTVSAIPASTNLTDLLASAFEVALDSLAAAGENRR